MIEVMLNSKNMTSKEKAHEYIKKRLKLVDHYGGNLDALWDVLSIYDRSIKVTIVNGEKLLEKLGDYGEDIIKVFQDAEKENKNINVEVIYWFYKRRWRDKYPSSFYV